jgi:hypothetical protein
MCARARFVEDTGYLRLRRGCVNWYPDVSLVATVSREYSAPGCFTAYFCTLADYLGEQGNRSAVAQALRYSSTGTRRFFWRNIPKSLTNSQPYRGGHRRKFVALLAENLGKRTRSLSTTMQIFAELFSGEL